MTQPLSSRSLDHFDTSSNSGDSLSECESVSIPDPNDPATVQRFIDQKISPSPKRQQRIDQVNIKDSNHVHIGDIQTSHIHFHGVKLPVKSTQQEETEENAEDKPNAPPPNAQVQAIPCAPPQNIFKRFRFFLMERSRVFWLVGLIMAITSITSLTLFYCFYNFNSVETNMLAFGHNDNLGDGIQVIQRSDWLARPPLNVTKLDHPLKMVRIMHTGGSHCKDYQTCASKVLALQGWQVGNQNMEDIAYNYLIGGDGNVYEGRGAGVENRWKKNAIDVVYIGNYLKPYDQVTDKMDQAGRRLLKRLEDQCYLTSDYIVVAQNQTFNTQSPGENVYSRIVKWPHYDSGLYFSN